MSNAPWPRVVPAVARCDRDELQFIKESALQQEILQVVETAQSVYFMAIVYDEGDIGNAVGNVFAFSGARQPGIVLKIETRAAFEHLPALLFSAMRSPRLGVMIARGDLAVECGWERLAEVQEEILWICESAHVPVIWATQVLENLSKKGTPTRAEISDAALAEQAECVMLNKGPHIVETVSMLGGILTRMQAHRDKKSSLLRALRVSRMQDSGP